MVKRLRARYDCYAELGVEILGGKWKAVILCHIKEGRGQFGELRRRIPGLSDKVLSEKLRQLEDLGVIARVPADGATSRAQYRMTAFGDRLRPALDQLYRLGEAVAPLLDIRVTQDEDQPAVTSSR